MAYEEQDKATSLYITYMVYMIITRCTMALFFAVVLEETPWEGNLAPAQDVKI